MLAPLWPLVSVITTTFVMPFAAAYTPLSLPLPQDFNINQYISGQLTQNTLSTNVHYAAVAAAVDEGPQLKTFITNNQSCVRNGEDLSYRVVVRNIGNATASDVTVQFQYPQTTTFRDSDPKPTREELPDTRLIEWHAPVLPPVATTVYSVILNVQQEVESVAVNVTVFYVDDKGKSLQTLTSHLIDGPCGESPAPAASPLPSEQAKKPAIVCDPADINCSPTYQDLTLGLTYGDVARENRSVNCTDDGCIKKPDLGARFNEAIADIVPGECRVVDDDVITKPEFHDALNRRAQPAAHYMRPLYDSGQDYRGMTLENILEAIPHFIHVHEKLRSTHNNNWHDLAAVIENVLENHTEVEAALARYDQLTPQWEERIKNLHEGLLRDYRSLQDKKKRKFDPVANQATVNSGDSKCRACGPPCGTDQALRNNLLTVKPDDGFDSVKEIYVQSLNEREAAYPQTQSESATRYSQFLNAVRPQFQTALERYVTARTAAEQSPKNKELAGQAADAATALRQFPHVIPNLPAGAALDALQVPYDIHDHVDEARDETIRINNWETALDTPKTAATDCAKENIFPPSVETTWCESGSSPELIIQEAPEPAKAKAGAIRPPADISGIDPFTGKPIERINENAVKGVACRDLPDEKPTQDNPFGDDPYWTLNCKCRCGELVPCGGTLYRCEDLYTCTFDPLDRLERHDVYVTSQLECFWDGSKHEDPYL